MVLGVTSRSLSEHLLNIQAACEVFPLVMDAGDSEVSRELNPSNILNSGVEIPGGAIGIDVGEQARWLDGVDSSPGSSKVVRSRD